MTPAALLGRPER